MVILGMKKHWQMLWMKNRTVPFSWWSFSLEGLSPWLPLQSSSPARVVLAGQALEVPSHTPELNDEDRQNLLDALSCFYDFSGSKPSSSGELRDAWDRAQSMQDECRKIYWPSLD